MGRKAIIALWALALLFLFSPAQSLAGETELVFSEIMYDLPGSDSGKEWVEVYNAGQEEVIVTSSWRFFDSANHVLSLVQGTSTIAAAEFFILADNAANFLVDYPDYLGTLFDTAMSLSNASSTVYLSFDSGATYPIAVSYESTWGAAGNGYSLEKIVLSQDSSQVNWQQSSILGGTPGLPSSDPSDDPPDEEDPPEDDPPDESPDEDIAASWEQIIISEFLPNPVGSDDYEWIELYNRGPLAVNLSGFGLSDDTARIFILSDSNIENIILQPYQFIVLYRQTTKIALNNSGGDSVKLYDPLGNILEIAEYRESAPEGKSYARENNQFFWTKILTPGAPNQISCNQNPLAQIRVTGDKFVVGEKIEFFAGNSFDPDGDDLDYQWDFGDGGQSSKETVKYSYKQAGAYTVLLEVSDSEGGRAQARYDLSIKIEEKSESDKEEDKKENKIENKIAFNPDFNKDDFFISEFLPDPVGSDDYEWIELYNASSKNIDLYGWQVDDIEGGSKPYTFATSTILAANSFLLLERQTSKIALNNDSDSVRLLTPSGELWQEVKYEKIPEGKSYAWDFENKEWFVSSDPSMGLPNYRLVEDSQSILAASDLGAMTKNAMVLVEGVVLADYIKGENSLYLADYSQGQPDFEQLIEVYCYYKDFPALKSGQLILVNGQLSKTEGIVRIKIKGQGDIVSKDTKINLKASEPVLLEDLDSDYLNSFTSVKGVVVKKSGKNIYLAPEIDQDYLVRIYAKYGWGDWEIKKGLTIMASGILTELDNAFKLSPLSDKDIILVEEVLGEKIAADEMLADDLSENKIFDSKDKEQGNKKVFLFILAGAALLGGVYFFKKRQAKMAEENN